MELKPCPFCGTVPVTDVRVTKMGGGEDHIDFSVVCEKCGTCKSSRLKIVRRATYGDVEDAMSTALDAWNRRAE